MLGVCRGSLHAGCVEGVQCLQPAHLRISINLSHFQYFRSKFSNFLENVIFSHTNVLQPRHSISVFFEILQYFQQKISKNTDKSVQLEALGVFMLGVYRGSLHAECVEGVFMLGV